jgi:hypothetical protein
MFYYARNREPAHADLIQRKVFMCFFDTLGKYNQSIYKAICMYLVYAFPGPSLQRQRNCHSFCAMYVYRYRSLCKHMLLSGNPGFKKIIIILSSTFFLPFLCHQFCFAIPSSMCCRPAFRSYTCTDLLLYSSHFLVSLQCQFLLHPMRSSHQVLPSLFFFIASV